MINFILTKILKSRGFAIAIIVGLALLLITMLITSYFKTKQEILNCKNEIKEYKRMEEEVKVYHEENIEKLKQSIQNAKKNAKKNDFNDTGNLDDDFLLKALE
jgi:uncharacterized membrane protein (DUF106 family)